MQKISKTKIKKHLSNKTSTQTIDIIIEGKKHPAWMNVIKKLASSTKNYDHVNLNQLESGFSSGDTVVVVGKILSIGNLTKKIRICALGISSVALKKIKDSKSEFIDLLSEIKNNPKMEKVKLYAKQ